MEVLDALLARHRKELRDLQSRITQKKKNATKKTKRGVLSECEALERDIKERHQREVRGITGVVNEGGEGEAEAEAEGEREGEDDAVAGEEGLSGKMGEMGLGSDSKAPNGIIILEPQPSPSSPQTTAATSSNTNTTNNDNNNNNNHISPSSQPRRPKPNRAKARLARRAAEIEAQATAAAQEASTQPDLRAAELATLRSRFSTLGLTEQDIPPDGHCLYSAFADQLEWVGLPVEAPLDPSERGESRNYKLARLACANYLNQNKNEFAPFLDWDAGEDMEGHIVKVRDTAEWGGQMEVLALAKAYGVVANVVQAEGGVIRMGEDEAGDGNNKTKEVWLAYYRHRFGLGEHYNSLRAKR